MHGKALIYPISLTFEGPLSSPATAGEDVYPPSLRLPLGKWEKVPIGVAAGLNFIRLATPTTDDARLPRVLQNTSGFVYYVSITGITGAAAATAGDVGPEVARIKAQTKLPVIVGFGIRTPEAAEAIASVADGAVVGSAIVQLIGEGKSTAEVLEFVAGLAAGAHRG